MPDVVDCTAFCLWEVFFSDSTSYKNSFCECGFRLHATFAHSISEIRNLLFTVWEVK